MTPAVITAPSLLVSSRRPFAFLGRSSFRRSIGTCLMVLVVFEAALLGSGQMLHVGGVTVKMILFGLSVVYVLVSLVCGDRLSMSTMLLIEALLCCLAIAGAQGLLRGATLGYVAQDISPQIYMVMLPFFELTIRSGKDLLLAVRIIMICAMIMTLVNVIMLIGLLTGKIGIATLYDFLLNVGAGDFMYDGLTYRIFYKGSLYIAVALLLFAFRKGLLAKLGMMIASVALALTVSRGFLVALFSVIFLYVLLKPSRPHIRAAYVIVLFLGMGVVSAAVLGFAGDKTESDTIRLVTINQVAERVDLATLFFGHGFGVGVPQRPEHMEIAYLETFHKQGLLGLAWLAAFAGFIVARFTKALQFGDRQLAYPLFLSSVFIFVESATNPFINNPIGLSAVLICLAGLKVLADPKTSDGVSAENKEFAFG